MKFDLIVDENGLVPAIAQNAITGQVLMLGYVSQESLKLTFEHSEVWFYSRSRKALWRKGETSGNFLTVESINVDCDQDAIVLQVVPNGPTCHTGENSCFFTYLSIENAVSKHFIKSPNTILIIFIIMFKINFKIILIM